MRRTGEDEGRSSSMNRYSKTLLLALLAAATVFFPNAVRTQGQTKQQPKPAAQEPEPEYSEEEFDAYEKATQEKDLDKRATMLLAFIQKFPKSKLTDPYIVPAYQTLLYEYSKNQKYDKLEPAAEQWLKIHPDDLQTIGFIAEAAQNLGHDQKYLEYAEKIYGVKPSGSLAYHIGLSFKKVGNQAKHLEWTEKLFSYPEFDGEYGIRYSLMQKYVDEKSYPKAAEYAQLTLKSVELAKKPDATSEDQWRKDLTSVRRACYYVIGLNDYEGSKYKEAIKALQQAIKAEKFGEGYYYIGMSQWKLKEIEEAMISFARAELQGGPTAAQAKDHVEELYKGIHNNTTIGIDKIYRKAKEEAPAGN